jgi:hypothetical protein
MTETVTSCQKVKDWTTPDGAVKPIYGIGLSDGRGGESFKEIPIGTPVSDLQMEQTFHGLRIKWNKPGQQYGGGGFKKERSGSESFALSYSKDLVVAGKVDLKDILKTADKFYEWLEGKKPAKPAAAPAPQAAAPAPAPKPQPAPAAVDAPTDDLPF